LSNTNPTEIWSWTQVFQKGKQFSVECAIFYFYTSLKERNRWTFLAKVLHSDSCKLYFIFIFARLQWKDSGVISCIARYLRNKSWKPECVGSFNMDWWILVFYPSQKRGIKFTNIRQSILKLKTHSGFHDLFRFWYV